MTWAWDPDELTQHLKDAERLSKAHNDFTGKGQVGGMWRIAQQGGPVALLALGIYGAAHGMGIYGFMPYLMAMGAARGGTSLATRIRAGETMGDLAQQLPPEAFDVNRPFSQVAVPQGPANPNVPPPFGQMPTGATNIPPPAKPTGPLAGFQPGRGTAAARGVMPKPVSEGPGLEKQLRYAVEHGTPEEAALADERLAEMEKEGRIQKSRPSVERLKRARGSRAQSGVWGGKR